MKKRHSLLAALLGYAAYTGFYPSKPTIISLRIGAPFAEVARVSTFPVIPSSNVPDNPLGLGTTWVKEPAVVIRYNDPQYGFTLPATTFAAIGYVDGKVSTIATTPMLNKLPFNQVFEELKNLQRQFQAGGWQLENESHWFDLTPRGGARLHQELLTGNHGFVKWIELVAPEKYSMTFRVYCADRCDSRIGLDRYLIDIGVAEDINYKIRQWKRQQSAPPAP